MFQIRVECERPEIRNQKAQVRDQRSKQRADLWLLTSDLFARDSSSLLKSALITTHYQLPTIYFQFSINSASSRTPNPVGPALQGSLSRSRSAVPAMSICAQGTEGSMKLLKNAAP